MKRNLVVTNSQTVIVSACIEALGIRFPGSCTLVDLTAKISNHQVQGSKPGEYMIVSVKMRVKGHPKTDKLEASFVVTRDEKKFWVLARAWFFFLHDPADDTDQINGTLNVDYETGKIRH